MVTLDAGCQVVYITFCGNEYRRDPFSFWMQIDLIFFVFFFMHRCCSTLSYISNLSFRLFVPVLCVYFWTIYCSIYVYNILHAHCMVIFTITIWIILWDSKFVQWVSTIQIWYCAWFNRIQNWLLRVNMNSNMIWHTIPVSVLAGKMKDNECLE